MAEGERSSGRLNRIFADSAALLRHLRRSLYWRIIGIQHKLVGTRIYESKWASFEPSSDKILSETSHPHRRWLLDRFALIGPFDSVLEVGCGPGVNLQLLCERFQLMRVCGIDVNFRAIADAMARIGPGKCIESTLRVGRADDLSCFGDRSIDVVFCDATLLYIGPDKIGGVLSEMKRVARKRLLFLELHQSGIGWLGIHSPDGWLRDYVMALREYCEDSAISVSRLPKEVWPAGRWPMHGHLIVANVEVRSK